MLSHFGAQYSHLWALLLRRKLYDHGLLSESAAIVGYVIRQTALQLRLVKVAAE
jgi:hypothetical protein